MLDFICHGLTTILVPLSKPTLMRYSHKPSLLCGIKQSVHREAFNSHKAKSTKSGKHVFSTSSTSKARDEIFKLQAAFQHYYVYLNKRFNAALHIMLQVPGLCPAQVGYPWLRKHHTGYSEVTKNKYSTFLAFNIRIPVWQPSFSASSFQISDKCLCSGTTNKNIVHCRFQSGASLITSLRAFIRPHQLTFLCLH